MFFGFYFKQIPSAKQQFQSIAQRAAEGNRAVGNFGDSVAVVEIGTDKVRAAILTDKPLERKSDDRRRIETDAQFQKHGLALPCLIDKRVIARSRLVPCVILHKTGVLTDMHFHICAADGTNGHERCGNAAIFLTAHHFPHGRLVVV